MSDCVTDDPRSPRSRPAVCPNDTVPVSIARTVPERGDGDRGGRYGPLVLRWIAVAVCAVQGGYMVVDGVRALAVGSYFTPRSGKHAGKLGPWARVVSAVGIRPESTGMKVGFVVLGVLWLALAAGWAAGAGWARPAGIVLAIGTLWYLVPGTVISVLVLVLLLGGTGS